LFLLIETASDVCSVALTRGENVLAEKQTNERNHAAALAPLIESLLRENKAAVSDLTCIGVNGGPGSYTGLRIGLSTAKGMCFAANVPLIMIDALQAYAQGLLLHQPVSENDVIISTVENRRDELFYAVFDFQLNRIQDVTLTVVTNDELQKRLGGNCFVAGSGVEKLKMHYPSSTSLRYVVVKPSAVNLLAPVLEKFNARQLADIAYSEPFYYKDVYIAAPKR